MTKIDTIMNDLYTNEIAIDLEVAEEEVQMKNITTFNGDDCCQPITFCCIVTVPKDYVLTNGLAHVTFDPECLKLKFKRTIPGIPVDGCLIEASKYKIKGCISVHASANAHETSANNPTLFHVCCSSCLCIKACVICCNPHIDVTNLDNIIIDANLIAPPTEIACNCDSKVYELSGEINISLVNCN